MGKTVLKKEIGLGQLGDAIDFALILQFAIFAILSLASLGYKSQDKHRLVVPLTSLAANAVLGAWHCCTASSLPMALLVVLVFAPLIASSNR